MKTRQQKEESVKSLTEKLTKAKSVVFTDYKGLNMTQLSALRGQLRDQGAEFNVTKNSLLKLALKDSGMPQNEMIETGPTATLFAYEDETTPIKALVKALKDAGIGKVKNGLFNGELVDEPSIIRLSNLPSKSELQAKVVGSLASPLCGIVGVLQANIRNLVYAVDQIRVKKGGEAQA